MCSYSLVPLPTFSPRFMVRGHDYLSFIKTPLTRRCRVQSGPSQLSACLWADWRHHRVVHKPIHPGETVPPCCYSAWRNCSTRGQIVLDLCRRLLIRHWSFWLCMDVSTLPPSTCAPFKLNELFHSRARPWIHWIAPAIFITIANIGLCKYHHQPKHNWLFMHDN